MSKTFRPWDVDQGWLFPPSVKDLVPPGHLAHFVRDLVREELDLSSILETYTEERGYPPYHPAMMTALLLYAYSRGVYSSRKMETACVERIDFMAVTAMAKPDHSTICEFRLRHRRALAALFVQVLRLCQKAHLVKLGHVALDGTKVKANASRHKARHKAMSYGRMLKAEKELAEEVERWLSQADRMDEEEDEEYGPDHRGDEMPPWVKEKAKRLAKIREAKAALEREAKEEAELAARKIEEKRRRGEAVGGWQRGKLKGVPEEKSQRNFTDPESRIMRVGHTYVQSYNCQAAVDAESQVIASQKVTAQQSDHDELLPVVDDIEREVGRYPRELSADASYCSEANLAGLEDRGVSAYIATGRREHRMATATSNERAKSGPLSSRMRTKLRRGGWRSRYRLRKQTVEPVFGQIKEARGFHRFLLRGLEKVKTEWALLCTAHNLLKLAKARVR
jgi:transposase